MRRPSEWHKWNPFVGPVRPPRPVRAAREVFAAERERWALWLPVCLGTGIAVYFGLDGEPAIWIGPLGIVAASAVGLAGRRRGAWTVLAVAAGTIALGLTLAQVRTAWVTAPVLEKRIGPASLLAAAYRSPWKLSPCWPSPASLMAFLKWCLKFEPVNGRPVAVVRIMGERFSVAPSAARKVVCNRISSGVPVLACFTDIRSMPSASVMMSDQRMARQSACLCPV